MNSTEPAETTQSKFRRHQEERRSHWDSLARKTALRNFWQQSYRRRLSESYRFLVPPGQRVLELGCGTGELLASLNPGYGVGVDLSPRMVKIAGQRFPDLHFIEADVHELKDAGTFDVIILSDLVNDLWDVQTVLERLHLLSGPQTRIIINSYSRVWELPLKIAQALGLKNKLLPQNWLTNDDVGGLLNLAGFEVIRCWREILIPVCLPIINFLGNRLLAKIWPFHYLGLTNFTIARPAPFHKVMDREPLVSVVVAARNESGNIADIFTRTPRMGRGTELIFVEGGSTDDTYQVIERTIAEHPKMDCKLFRQSGKGKGDAVRLGFEKASGDILMILDADLTMPPEYLPRFYEAICSGKGEFVNGVRLVYPMEKKAMRLFNFLGNKFFSLAFSWLLGQPIKDTLCGTKVLWKDHYRLIAANRSYFGEFDPFGDFDLLFGAARLNLAIVEIPIRYAERTYGDTNIQRWRHGLLLIRMVLFAIKRIKFI